MDRKESSAQYRDRFGNWTGSGVDVQTKTMNTEPDNAYEGMRRNILVFAQDALRLADLQGQLFSHDLSEFWQRARLGIVFCAAGAAIVLGAVPVLLLGLSEFLQTAFDLRYDASRGIVGGIGLLLGGAMLLLSIRLLTKAGTSLNRSQTELRENIAWLRAVLEPKDD